jgi:Sulphur transport
MDQQHFDLAFLIAALSALLMGFAIQRGATCTVAAVDECVNKKKATRLIAMIEASIWVAGGLMLARLFQFHGPTFTGHELTALTILGAALLGLGAFINGACVFGAVARIGNGQGAYLATPVGFYLGCQIVSHLALPASASVQSPESIVLNYSAVLVWPFLLFVIWRSFGIVRGVIAANLGWSPHVATLVIGLTFLLTWQLAGAWAYTDLLADFARSMSMNTPVRITFAILLFLGAIVGGRTSGKFGWQMPKFSDILRCLAGGLLMGVGSLLTPGSNDGLVLLGMPLLLPYAWVAFATMCLTIAVCLLVSTRLSASPR